LGGSKEISLDLMKRYKIKIDPDALSDIHEIAQWYDNVQNRLGHRFLNTTIKQINSLNKNPGIYAIRYNDIRCMIIKKFPNMVHFYINDETHTVEVLAVINTYRNPNIWEEKTVKKF
jgi:hypothetical protein